MKPMIELIGVSKTVKSGGRPLTIVHPVDLVVPSGQLLSIVGPSGSGKSTLLGLIAGLDTPSTGRVLIDGSDITSMNEDQVAQFRGSKVGFVFQFFHLIPSLTARENILIPLELASVKEAGKVAASLLDEVGLTERAHHYPSQLSGGEQQRVAVARALANNPQVVLADEPTGNLDQETGQQIIELLIRINRTRSTTLLLVTHDEKLAKRTDVTVAMQDGVTSIQPTIASENVEAVASTLG